MVLIVKRLLLAVLRVIAPPFCASCRCMLDDWVVLCPDCIILIKPVVSTTVTISPSMVMTVHAIGTYSDPLKSLILAKRLANRVASRQLGQLIWQLSSISHLEFDLIVCVPLHWTRYAWRGYNQAHEIAQVIADTSGKPLVNLVRRTRKTVFQSSIAHDKRRDNVKSAFTLCSGDHAAYYNKTILVVDDLMTTGSTISQVAKQLLPLKPKKIIGVVAARTV